MFFNRLLQVSWAMPRLAAASSSAAPQHTLAANLASAGVNLHKARNVASVGTERLSGSMRTAIARHSAPELAVREGNLSRYTRSGRCLALGRGMGAASATALVSRNLESACSTARAAFGSLETSLPLESLTSPLIN